MNFFNKVSKSKINKVKFSKEKLLIEYIDEKDNIKGHMTKLKLQMEQLSDKNKTLIEESRSSQDKIKLLEEKNAATKITVQNLKIQLKEKDNDAGRIKDSISHVETLKSDNGALQKKLEDQTKKMKQVQLESE